MKNVKKLSRQELKVVSGAGISNGPIYLACADPSKKICYLKNGKTACIPRTSNCDDFKEPTPVLE